jgi:uncharacterized protein (TIGR03118 family)
VKQAPSNFEFTDANLPAGYAPSGIQALPTGLGGAMEIYVAYAMKIGDDEEVGDGLGIVDVYDANGALIRRLVDDGDQLNAPRGFALALDDAGSVSNAVLVGNVGDGKVNAFDLSTGDYVGTIKDPDDSERAPPGLLRREPSRERATQHGVLTAGRCLRRAAIQAPGHPLHRSVP